MGSTGDGTQNPASELSDPVSRDGERGSAIRTLYERRELWAFWPFQPDLVPVTSVFSTPCFVCGSNPCRGATVLQVEPAQPFSFDTSAFRRGRYPKHFAGTCFACSLRFGKRIVGVHHIPPRFALEAMNSASEPPFSPVDGCAKLTGGCVLAGLDAGLFLK